MKSRKKDEHRHVHLGVSAVLIIATIIGTILTMLIGHDLEKLLKAILYCLVLLVVDKVINYE
ncbi:hypothetical protein [Latilactobacillus curvatus]|uniref:hypothetical protein n=1 Tax=Latilactobacillus curvatus TaxID=28038 RepID=UPI00280C07E2|nr:hypothetical protein [Latilactobacillus curvatus]